MGTVTTRVGGLCGVASAAAVVPAYLVGSPEVPGDRRDTREYFDQALAFTTANGTLPLLHVLFGLLFLGVLVTVLRRSAGPTALVYVALLGGAVFFALTSAGLAAEVAVPAAIVRFDDLSVIDQAEPFLALATWLYHYSQIGSAIMVFAVAALVWRNRVFPRWAVAFAVFGVLPLLHTWIGLPGAVSTAAWIALTGLLMLISPPAVGADVGEV